MSARIQEVLSLSSWYADVLRRHEQLAAWTAGSLAPPHSVWLSGLFNPKAFLTAVRLPCHACAHSTSACQPPASSQGEREHAARTCQLRPTLATSRGLLPRSRARVTTHR